MYRAMAICAVLGGGCVADAGLPAEDVVIVMGARPGESRDAWLFEVPTTAGFYGADFSELYGAPVLGSYGASESLTQRSTLYQAQVTLHPVSGRLGGRVTIHPAPGALLYSALLWQLLPDVDYDAVWYQPVPGQPLPPSGMPVTTFLAVCPYDTLGIGCRSWPGAVRDGWVRCLDRATRAPISDRKCSLLAPYVRWHIQGTPPIGSVDMAPLLDHLAADARLAMPDVDGDREGEEQQRHEE